VFSKAASLVAKWTTRPRAPERLIPEPAEKGFISSFDGTEIYWERHGPSPRDSDATPMIFCYGLVCSFNQWRYQLTRYSKERPCYVFDYRGHGKSAEPTDMDRINLSALAKDAAAVIKVHGNRRPFIVWGHSMGASVALELAVAEPELCKALVLCCASVDNPFKHMFGTPAFDVGMKALLRHFPENTELFYSTWKRFMSVPLLTKIVVKVAGFNADASTDEDVETYVNAVSANPARTFFPLIIEMSRGITAQILEKVRVPSVVVAGAKDHITPRDTQHYVADRLVDSDYVEIPAGSHNVQLDFGEYVSLKVEDSLKRRSFW
jgi:pimeloyl-ACP methyl ester carboxylesterase